MEKGLSLEDNLFPQLANLDTHGGGFEELTLLYLHKTLSVPTPLNYIFQFHEKKTPSWANKSGQLVLQVEPGRFEPFDFPGSQPTHIRGATLHADSIKDVLQWIRGNAPTAAFALPYHLFRPDLMGWIRCNNDPPILLLRQDRSHTSE